MAIQRLREAFEALAPPGPQRSVLLAVSIAGMFAGIAAQLPVKDELIALVNEQLRETGLELAKLPRH